MNKPSKLSPETNTPTVVQNKVMKKQDGVVPNFNIHGNQSKNQTVWNSLPTECSTNAPVKEAYSKQDRELISTIPKAPGK